MLARDRVTWALVHLGTGEVRGRFATQAAARLAGAHEPHLGVARRTWLGWRLAP